MKMLVDIGNRRLKWALSRAGEALDGPCGAFEWGGAGDSRAGLACQLSARLTAQWSDQCTTAERPTSLWVSCVARPEIRQAVAEYARRAWSVRPVFVASSRRQSGVVNGCPHPPALGCDRWAALVAARNLCPRRAVIVVDAGTVCVCCKP